MKKLILFLLLLIGTISFSQRIRAFGTFGIHLRGGFEKNSIANFGGGFEFRILQHLRPEIEASYYIGSLPDQKDLDQNNNTVNASLVRTVSAVNYSFSPKIMFDIGDDDPANRFYLQIMPKFNFTSVTAKGTFFELNNSKTSDLASSEDKFNEQRKSFGIAIGIIMQFSKKSYDAFAFNLFYNNIDIGNALNQLKFNNPSINSSTAIGAGLSYYIGFIKPKTNKN